MLFISRSADESLLGCCDYGFVISFGNSLVFVRSIPLRTLFSCVHVATITAARSTAIYSMFGVGSCLY